MENLESNFYIQTGCAGEMLQLTDMYDDIKGKPHFLGICMAFYAHGHNNHNSLKRKLDHVWNIATKGTPWKDELIFDIDSAKQVRDKLTELINKAEKINE